MKQFQANSQILLGTVYFAKEIAYKNYQQNVDSDNLLLALIKDDNITKKILKKIM